MKSKHMLTKKIAIIGMGNMGRAMAHGILKHKIVHSKNLILSNSSTDNRQAVKNSDIVIVAVKPQVAHIVCEQIKDVITKKHLAISVMAGISIGTIESIFGKPVPIIRSMPNVCASIGESMTGWIGNTAVSSCNIDDARAIFKSFGEEIMLKKEEQINIVTAVSGSGPAYMFYLAENMIDAAVEMGLPETIAKQMVKQTLSGSAKILHSSDETPAELRKKVTSKGGTTEAAFALLYRKNAARIIIDAIIAARQRADNLCKNYE